MRAAFAIGVVLSAAWTLAACGLDAEGLGGGGSNQDAGLKDAPSRDTTEDATPDTTLRDSGTADTGTSQDAALHEGGPKPDAPSGDSGSPEDSGKDTSSPRDASDSSPPPDSGFVFTCGSGTTDNCETCGESIVGCLWCNGGSPVGFCIPVGTSCDDNVPPGTPKSAAACLCDFPSTSSCLGQSQGCVFAGKGYCLTCGQKGSNGSTCKGGGTCNEAEATCEP
jgi:hypothetical protein